jgi:hypothetical protein
MLRTRQCRARPFQGAATPRCKELTLIHNEQLAQNILYDAEIERGCNDF